MEQDLAKPAHDKAFKEATGHWSSNGNFLARNFRGWSQHRTKRFRLASQQGQTPLLSLLCLVPLSAERDIAILSNMPAHWKLREPDSLLSEEAVEENEQLRSLVLLLCRRQQLVFYTTRE